MRSVTCSYGKQGEGSLRPVGLTWVIARNLLGGILTEGMLQVKGTKVGMSNMCPENYEQTVQCELKDYSGKDGRKWSGNAVLGHRAECPEYQAVFRFKLMRSY